MAKDTRTLHVQTKREREKAMVSQIETKKEKKKLEGNS